jgi:hypothetical protein
MVDQPLELHPSTPYVPRPCGPYELADRFQPIVLRQYDYHSKDLFDIAFSVTRESNFVPCQAGDVTFYPLPFGVGVFRDAISIKYDGPVLDPDPAVFPSFGLLFIAFPLTKRATLAGEIFTNHSSSGMGFVPYPGDKATVFHWLASHISQTIDFSEIPAVDPFPARHQDPSQFAPPPLRTVHRAPIPALPRDAYAGRALSEILVPSLTKPDPPLLKIGNLLFSFARPGLVTVNGADIAPGLDSLSFGFPLTESGIVASCPLRRLPRWTPFAPNDAALRAALVELVQHAIDPDCPAPALDWEALSAAYVAIEALPTPPDPREFTPGPDPPASPIAQRRRTREAAIAAGRPVALDASKYRGMPLDQIALVPGKPCRVGGLVFYPRPGSAFVIGRDLHPRLDGMFVAFRIAGGRLRTRQCFVATDRGWKLFGRNNPEFLPAILALVEHAIDPVRPMPDMERPMPNVRSEPSVPVADGERRMPVADGERPVPVEDGERPVPVEDGDALDTPELLWEAMVRVPREEWSGLRQAGGERERWLADFVRGVRERKDLSDETKVATIGRALSGALDMPNLDWEALAEAAEGLPPEIFEAITIAKRETYLTAVVYETPDRDVLERDEEIKTYVEMDEFEIDLRHRREAVPLDVGCDFEHEIEASLEPDPEEVAARERWEVERLK